MTTSRVALVHDWLNGMRGGENVLEAIAEIFPTADLYTLFHEKGTISPTLERHPVHASWLNRIEYARKRYRHFLPVLPFFAEAIDLKGYDLVISSSHCVAKGVLKEKGAVHLSYVHAPMRYIWDRFDDYFGEDRASPFTRTVAKAVRPWLRHWDRKSSQPERVDRLVANSSFIAEKIKAAYGRTASVVHPFVDAERFARVKRIGEGEAYLVFGALAPYKRIDLAIEAAERMGVPLWIAGSGQETERLKALAGPQTKFFGAVSDREIEDLFSRAKALLFPGTEDFGIVPLEALASGLPVIAYAAGGALETITPETGLFFHEQSASALENAMKEFEKGRPTRITETQCRARAAEFSKSRFQSRFREEVNQAWRDAGKGSSFFG